MAIIFLAVSGAACVLTTSRTESPKCNITSLVLDKEGMPDGWRNELGPAFLPAQDTLGAQQAYHVFMQNGDGTAHHTVYQYSNKRLATFHFSFEDAWFFPSGWEWSELEGAKSLSLQADQWQIKCGESDNPYLDEMCAAVLRYGPYISDFSASIQEGTMSTEEFKKVVLEIDEIFRSCEE